MRTLTLVFGLLLASVPAAAEQVSIAVASNFAAAAKTLAIEFENTTGHKAQLSFGSTGKFYAQITNGAPFDLLLAADVATPARLEREDAIVPGSRFTYANGRLVLWSARTGYVDAQGDVLRNGAFKRLAISNPALAPYGAAAIEVLASMRLLETIRPRFVQGENVAQTFQFVSSGNAELGFVAMSQVYENGQIKSGSGWLVPVKLHRPILQDAVLLKRSRGNAAATAFMAYLKSAQGRATIKSFGYDL